MKEHDIVTTIASIKEAGNELPANTKVAVIACYGEQIFVEACLNDKYFIFYTTKDNLKENEEVKKSTSDSTITRQSKS